MRREFIGKGQSSQLQDVFVIPDKYEIPARGQRTQEQGYADKEGDPKPFSLFAHPEIYI